MKDLTPRILAGGRCPTEPSSEAHVVWALDVGQPGNARQRRGRAYVEMLPSEDTISCIESAAATPRKRALASIPGILGIGTVVMVAISLVVV